MTVVKFVFPSIGMVVIASTSIKASFAQSTIQIDVRDYIAQPSNGEMLCQSDGSLCTTSRFNQSGEFQIDYTNGITNYFARTSGSVYPVGVVRSGDSDNLRCFSIAGQACTAPSNSNFMPGNIAEVQTFNIVTLQTELNGENGDGSPRFPLSGSTAWNNGNAYTFGVVIMDPSSCAQTYQYTQTAGLYFTYVQAIPFGGNIGTHDALVFDEVQAGATAAQNHLERAFYVKGLGIVREGSSLYDTSTGYYDKPLGGNSVRNVMKTNTITAHQVQCPQGSVSSLQD